MGKKKRSYRQKGGDGQGPRGHGYSFPIQYFGGKLDRYFAQGSKELVPQAHAYGENIPTSFGKYVPSLYSKNMTGPNLAPSPGSSGIQTGGRKLSKKRKNSKKGGSVVSDILGEARNLIVPAGLIAAKELIKRKNIKSGKNTKKKNTGKKTLKKKTAKKNKKGGSVVSDILGEARNLIVPAGLIAAKELIKRKNIKSGKNTKKKNT